MSENKKEVVNHSSLLKKNDLNNNGEKVAKLSVTMIKRLSIVTVVVNLLLLVVVGSVAENFIESKEEAYLREILANISNTIGATLEEYAVVANIVALNEDIIDLLEASDKENPMRSQELANRVISYTGGIESALPAVINVGICDIEQDSYLLHNGDVSGNSFSFKTRSYFSVTETKQSMITAPYIDAATGELVVTLASPVLNSRGTALGAIFVDLAMDFVVELVGNSGFGETGKSLIADHEGLLVACMDYEFIGTSYSNLGVSGDDLEREIANTTGKFIELHTNGEMSVGIVGDIPNTDWVLVTSIEKWEFNQDSNQLNTILIGMIILSIVLTLSIAVYTIQMSIKPIEYIREAMSELSKGNTRFKLKYESDDEIGILANDLRFTMKNLGDYINEINRQLECCGRGDFTIESDMEFLGDFAAIQVSINDFTALISQALNNMKVIVEQVSEGSHHVAIGSQDLAEGSSRQSDSVSVLNENVEDITKSVTENVKNVQHVNDCSNQASEELKKNNIKMNEMVNSMEEISRTSEGIQKIVKTIEDVAFQTNILALNAAVEAARAGTAGKGFAVVAEEVRNLSSRTSEAVQETSRLIEETAAAIDTGSGIVVETAKGLEEVIEFVSSFMGALEDITQASKHQADAVSEIQQSVGEITNVMQINSSISEQSAATSEELSSQASVMKETIGQFKTLD